MASESLHTVRKNIVIDHVLLSLNDLQVALCRAMSCPVVFTLDVVLIMDQDWTPTAH